MQDLGFWKLVHSTVKWFPKDACMPKVRRIRYVYQHMTSPKYTRAAIFSEVGVRDGVLRAFLHRSRWTGADAERDIRGFAMKFYTKKATGI